MAIVHATFCGNCPSHRHAEILDSVVVVPYKAVAEVSKIGHLVERLVVVTHGWQSEPTDGSKRGWSAGRSIYLSIYLSICLSSYLSIYLFIFFYVQLSIFLSIYPSIYLSIYLFTYLSFYLSIPVSVSFYIYI